jgi:hypothetical protein
MRIKGVYREIKFSEENANGDIIDTYYQIPKHDNDEDDRHQLRKQLLIHKGVHNFRASGEE